MLNLPISVLDLYKHCLYGLSTEIGRFRQKNIERTYSRLYDTVARNVDCVVFVTEFFHVTVTVTCLDTDIYCGV